MARPDTLRTRTVFLNAFEDANTGELGLGVEGINVGDEQLNAATEGLLIAHDLLEHVNGLQSIGPIADELEALGGIWFVRGQYGELRRDNVGSNYTVHQNVAADITRMFRDYFYASGGVLKAPRTRACDVEADLDDILEEAERTILGDIEGEDHEEALRLVPGYLQAARSLMRIGYRKAARRYGRYGYRINDLFWRISEAVAPHARYVEYEGQRFQLTYGIKDGAPFARCVEAFDEFDD